MQRLLFAMCKSKSGYENVLITLDTKSGKGAVTTKIRYTFAVKTETKPPKKH